MKLLTKRAGWCEGPLGLPMPSETAKAIESILASLDADCKAAVERAGGPIRRAIAPAEFGLMACERADVSLITTDAIDRDREVVYPGGIDTAQFEAAGMPVTFAHQYDQLPVGRAAWLQRRSSGWLAKSLYHARPENWQGDWFPDAVWHLVQSGSLRGKSIGFIPLEYRKPNAAEVKARPELADVRGVIPRSLLLEYAVAPIQSNPDALVQGVAKAKSAGFAFPAAALRRLGLVIPGEPAAIDWSALGTGPTGPTRPTGPTQDPEPLLTRAVVADLFRLAAAKAVAGIPATLDQAVARLRGRI